VVLTTTVAQGGHQVRIDLASVRAV